MKYGTPASRATYSSMSPYKGDDVDGYVQIHGKWYRLEENHGQTRELIGKYSVSVLGWGNTFVDYSSFTSRERALLKTTLPV